MGPSEQAKSILSIGLSPEEEVVIRKAKPSSHCSFYTTLAPVVRLTKGRWVDGEAGTIFHLSNKYRTPFCYVLSSLL